MDGTHTANTKKYKIEGRRISSARVQKLRNYEFPPRVWLLKESNRSPLHETTFRPFFLFIYFFCCFFFLSFQTPPPPPSPPHRQPLSPLIGEFLFFFFALKVIWQFSHFGRHIFIGYCCGCKRVHWKAAVFKWDHCVCTRRNRIGPGEISRTTFFVK